MNESSLVKKVVQPGNKTLREDLEKPARRMQDHLKPEKSERQIGRDRRQRNRERRDLGNTCYKGRARRYTVDRRLGTKDRRLGIDLV